MTYARGIMAGWASFNELVRRVRGEGPRYVTVRGRGCGGRAGSCYVPIMSAALKPMTIAEFLAWEERQEPRYEFDGFRPVAMTGGTFAHEVIGRNLRLALGLRLRGSRCQPLGPNSKIEVAGRIRYPDAFVLCAAVDRKATVIPGPVVVFEVLSDGTAHVDHIAKLREYSATPSIQRYVILEQDQIAAMVFTRDGGRMVVETVTRGGTLSMPEIGVVDLPIDELYQGVEPEEDGDSGDGAAR